MQDKDTSQSKQLLQNYSTVNAKPYLSKNGQNCKEP